MVGWLVLKSIYPWNWRKISKAMISGSSQNRLSHFTTDKPQSGKLPWENLASIGCFIGTPLGNRPSNNINDSTAGICKLSFPLRVTGCFIFFFTHKRFALVFFGSSDFSWFSCILGGPVTWEVQMVKPDDILVDFEGTNSLEDMRFLNIGGFSWLFLGCQK